MQAIFPIYVIQRVTSSVYVIPDVIYVIPDKAQRLCLVIPGADPGSTYWPWRPSEPQACSGPSEFPPTRE